MIDHSFGWYLAYNNVVFPTAGGNEESLGGVLLPGSLASREELLAMGHGIADGGGGVFELASSWDLYDDFVKEGRPDRELVSEYARKDRELLHAMATIPGVTVTTGGGSGQPVGGGVSMTPETAWSHTGVLEMIDAITAAGKCSRSLSSSFEEAQRKPLRNAQGATCGRRR